MQLRELAENGNESGKVIKFATERRLTLNLLMFQKDKVTLSRMAEQANAILYYMRRFFCAHKTIRFLLFTLFLGRNMIYYSNKNHPQRTLSLQFIHNFLRLRILSFGSYQKKNIFYHPSLWQELQDKKLEITKNNVWIEFL